MPEYEPVIGLEVHAELNTSSKIYCPCQNAFGGMPNTRVCPVCMGLPGTLPVLNQKAVEHAVRMGLALHCRVNPVSRQDRKHYFYPDLPKAYQISQADIPICEDGWVSFLADGEMHRIGIERLHIEEDAGKLIHDAAPDATLIDFNRCGVPLIEIVSRPDIRSSRQAKVYLDTIRYILQYLGISDCKMQEGSLRCDVNVSIRKCGDTHLGTRVEMKNVNSFSAAVRSIEYEVQRQIQILASGGQIEQETRRWDDKKGESILMRTKETAQDYHFLPEPDLQDIVLKPSYIESLRSGLPELPNEKIIRYVQDLGLTEAEAVLIIESPDKCCFFEDCLSRGTCLPKSVCNWILGDVSQYMNETEQSILDSCMTPERLCELICLTENGVVSSSAAKTVFRAVLERDLPPEVLITELGLKQDSDRESLKALVIRILGAFPAAADDYRNGKRSAMGFLIGQCMKASGGRANPVLLKELAEELLT